ncbi:Uncharacterized protein APZ42_020379 [Daphnia magna]|uniref:Uncharacterized protein n=1 Tax=Daphnia magna TaxID=35525 RepID=A0A164XJ64_9CRUS|nr:Uncharacterized protein APZ42_020379 [Daphnia magna]
MRNLSTIQTQDLPSSPVRPICQTGRAGSKVSQRQGEAQGEERGVDCPVLAANLPASAGKRSVRAERGGARQVVSRQETCGQGTGALRPLANCHTGGTTNSAASGGCASTGPFTPAPEAILVTPVEAQINQRHSVVENNFKEWTKRIRDEMDARERVIIGSLQQDDSLTKQVILESTKAMKKIKEDLLIELRQTRQTEQRETTGTMGNSMEEGATARSRTSSSTSAATTSCETRDELTAERYTLLTKLMGAALVVKSSRDKGERRVNTLKAQTRHERIEEITRKLAEISTAEERVSDHEQLDIALGEMVVLDQLAESQKRDSAPTTTTLVNCLALPLPVFNGEIAAWGSWKAAWSTKNTRLSNTSVLPQWWDDEERTFSKILKALKREIRHKEEDEVLSTSCSGKPVPESAATTSNNGNRSMLCFFFQKPHLHHICNQRSSARRRATCEKDGRCLARSNRTEHCISRIPCRHSGNTEHCPSVCVAKPRAGEYTTTFARNRGFSPQRPSKVVTIDTSTLTISTRSKTGVLPTFMAYLKGNTGDKITIVGLIDSGSERTFVHQDTVTRVGAEKVRAEYLAVNGFGDQNKAGKNHAIFSLKLTGLNKDAREIKIKAIARKFLANAKKVTPTDFSKILLSEGKDLAGYRYITGQQGNQFDIIVGCDFIWSIMQHKTVPGTNGLVACASKVGWLIFCTISENGKTEEQVLSATVDTQRPMADFKEFWSLDHMGITPQERSEPAFLEAYQETIQ